MRELEADTTLMVNLYRIEDYKTSSRPYEGHYPHYDTRVSETAAEVPFSAGDILVPTDQAGIRYIVETLEPEAVDSFFNWNYFDPILQQKEGFSPYVFEDIAGQILKENDSLKGEFNRKRETDTAFASSAFAQLNWIYRHSPHYENAHLLYPVYRLMQ